MIVYLTKILLDSRVSVWHIGLYLALLYLYYKQGCQNPVRISRSKVMAVAHIGSIVTYHKCLKELIEFGYITYHPSYHPKEGSKVMIL